MTQRLSAATAHLLPGHVARPGYAPDAHGTGIVHLGIGAFHRAHQAVMTDAAIAADGGDWRIIGASLRSPDMADRLNPQDGRYVVSSRSAAGAGHRLIASVAGVMVARDDPSALLARMADPAVRIISLTITEKGYCHDPASGALNRDHPSIRADLANRAAPASAPGLLVAALSARRAAGIAPPVILSCDNLPHNGQVLGGVLAALGDEWEAGLGDWIRSSVATPATMVDRIVPAITVDAVEAFEAETGLRDEGLLLTEPFTQWVIEDFAGPRPAWEAGGALFVADVRPFEFAKLRLLNGSHSAIAWMGQLAGWGHVHEAMGNPGLRHFVAALMDEAEATLAPVPGLSVAGYRTQLMERFANPALAHRTRQIAMDSSQKLPQRLIGTARDRLANGLPIEAVGLGIAAWLAFVIHETADGRPLDDPLADPIAALVASRPAADAIASLLGFAPVFGDIGGDPRFFSPVSAAALQLLEQGAPAVLAVLA